MKFKPMEKVCITSDTLNYDLPLEQVSYIVKVDQNANDAHTYCVRVPSKKESWWVPECDLMNYDEWIDGTLESNIQESLVNRALETRDKSLFEAITKR